MATEVAYEDRPNGPVAAAFLAAGIGSVMMGLMTILVEANAGISKAANWSSPVGPLSGKVGVTLIVYALSWLVLGLVLRGKNVNLGRYMTIAFILLLLGFLFTFPPFFDLFAPKSA
jgi:hypothetical protein